MSKKGTKALASATLMSLVLTTALSAGPVKAASVERQGGSDRIHTAITVANSFGTADTVVLVNGNGFADAVSATPLAKAYNAPILLTNGGALEADVASAISSLKAKNVLIVGGTGVVSSAIETSLKANYTVTRYAGTTDTSRFGTSAAVAQAVVEKTGKDTAILVNGQDGYADALSVASIAAAKGYPVLITNSNSVSDAVKNVVAAKNLKVLAVGGDAVLPASVVAQVNGTKIANGGDRFATNLAVLNYFKSDLNFGNIYVAAGGADSSNQFADALVASAAAAKTGAPVVLTGLGASDAQKAAAQDYVKNNVTSNAKVTIVGQTGSVDSAVESGLNSVLAPATLSVDSVSAVNASSFSISGTALNQLTAADITVAGNTVASITPATDGKTATVTVNGLITPNVEQTVTIKGTDYKFTYSLVASTAAITAKTYDSNTPDQRVAFTVNGATANVDDLVANGYTVAFSATDKDATTDTTSTLFANAATGELNTALTAGTDYKVQVIITNGTTSIVSPVQTISIQNLYKSASAINSYQFTNETNSGTVIQNSTKLVVGETGEFTQLKVLEDGTEQKETTTTDWTVKSSNPAVISVDSSDIITANAPGTATLTITFGSVTKDVTFTVVDTERKLTSVKVTKSATDDTVITSKTVVSGTPATVSVQPLDQFGDPMNAEALNVYNPDSTVATTSLAGTDASGKNALTITYAKNGNITLLFKNPSNNTTIGSFPVTTTNNTGASTKTLAISAPISSSPVTQSADNTLDLSNDYQVIYQLKQYNSSNVYIGAANLNNYTVTTSDSTIANLDVAGTPSGTATTTLGSVTSFTIDGIKAGTATLTVKDATNVVVGTIGVNVVDNGIKITGVTFKPQTATLNYAKTVDFGTFLSNTDGGAGADSIISGITLSKSTNSLVRIDSTGELYLDKDGSGTNNTGDVDLGKVVLTASTDSTSLSVASNSVSVSSGSKGTLVFKVIEKGTPTVPKVYGSTSLNVDVK